MSTYAGIEIGGSKLQVVLEDEEGTVHHRSRIKVNPREGAKIIRKEIEQIFAGLKDYYSIEGVGVGFGGPVDRNTGRVIESFQVPGWTGFDLLSWIRYISGSTNVFIENDANIAAFGEAIRGAGRGFNSVFYVTLGSGTGSGFVSEKKIYHGSSMAEMEFGHIRINKSGTTVEDACSGWAVDRQIREIIVKFPSSVLAKLVAEGPGNEARHLKTAIEQDDKIAKEIFKDTMDSLAFALSHVVHLLSPDVIIIGGGLSLMGEMIIQEIQNKLPGYLMEVFQPIPMIKLSGLQEGSVPAGAIEWAKYNLKKNI